ncbi:MAG: OmpA family protein [Melioribacteraceae bacterium]
MKSKLFFLLSVILFVAFVNPVYSQLSGPGWGGGVSLGGTIGQSDFTNREHAHHIGRAFLRYGLSNYLGTELGIGVAKVSGTDYQTVVHPLEFRLLLFPYSEDNFDYFIYGGAGYMRYELEHIPDNATNGEDLDGWMGVIPVGLGLQFRLLDKVALETTAGYYMALKDNLEAFVSKDNNDGFFTFTIGLTVTSGDPNRDTDGDGLTDDQEEELGTNPEVADTDGDGLSDGVEFLKIKTDPKVADSDGDGLSDGDEVNNYKTDPNKADTDADGLKDGDEINVHQTDPLKADTDGDGLSDSDELLKYKTNPVKADTDSDGLKDGEEINKHKTDPLKGDTDGDGLNDSSEVLTYKSNPFKKDTDDGTVDDNTEVKRGTNPLNPDDDVVKVGVAMVLDGITFETGKAAITPESEATLQKALKTLTTYQEISVEISGHTDNVGSAKSNQKLSEQRAIAVKDWLIKNGIDAGRLTAAGYGSTKPMVPNDTKENKAMNRRIEFSRTK